MIDSLARGARFRQQGMIFMRQFVVIVVLLAACLTLANSARAGTFVIGVPNVVQAPGANGPCASFQLGSLNQWFVVPTSDAGYVDEFGSLTVAQSLGRTVTVTDAGSTVSSCQGYELAQNIQLGGVSCPNNLAMDLTSPCDTVEAVLVGGF